jgi:hypothetical protein
MSRRGSEQVLRTLYTQLKLNVTHFTTMWKQMRGCDEADSIRCECEEVHAKLLDLLRGLMDVGATRSQADEEESHSPLQP